MSDKWVWNKPFRLPNSGTSGRLDIDIPKAAEYIAVMNGTGAQVAYSKGTNYDQPPDAIVIQPYVYMGLPMELTQKLTLHWTAINGELSSSQDKGVLIFSNQPIVVSGGPVTTGGVASNVNVQNTPSVNINTIPNLVVASMPNVVLNPAGTLPAGVNHLGEVAVNVLPALPVGANHIGEVAVNTMPVVHVVTDSQADPPNLDVTLSSLVAAVDAVTTSVNAVKSLQGATVGIITTSRVSVLTTATVLFNGVVDGDAILIQNQDAGGTLYIGPASVDNSTGGLAIAPGGVYTMDVITGSTIVMYGVGSVALTVGISVVN